MRQGSEPMEHHSGELDHQNEGEKEHEHKTYRFQLQVFLGYQHLVENIMWKSPTVLYIQCNLNNNSVYYI
jgi:hypothetical protein